MAPILVVETTVVDGNGDVVESPSRREYGSLPAPDSTAYSLIGKAVKVHTDGQEQFWVYAKPGSVTMTVINSVTIFRAALTQDVLCALDVAIEAVQKQ